MTKSTLVQELAATLRANGLTDEPGTYDGSMHSWRCSYPDVYGPCDCFAELVNDLASILAQRIRDERGDALAEAAKDPTMSTTGTCDGTQTHQADPPEYVDGWALRYCLNCGAEWIEDEPVEQVSDRAAGERGGR